MVSFCKEARPDRTTQLETTLDVERPVKAILSDPAHMGKTKVHPPMGSPQVSGKDGVQARVTAPSVRSGLKTTLSTGHTETEETSHQIKVQLAGHSYCHKNSFSGRISEGWSKPT